ncbi:hypothetical protein CHUAL_006743 [Chamberlinius hualienensis]
MKSKLGFLFINSLKRSLRVQDICSRKELSKRYVSSSSNSCEEVKIEAPHVPVMTDKVLEMMSPSDNQIIIDMTFGAGGHTEILLNAANNLKVVAVDRDPLAYNYACQLAEKYNGRVIPVLGKFSELESLLTPLNIRKEMIDGILFDVGASSMQMNDSGRGFAISKDGPLDMRMNPNVNQLTACDVVNKLDATSLTRIFRSYGEERKARGIAEAIVQTRYNVMEITTTHQLATLVSSILEKFPSFDKLGRFSHPATKVFQALRIFVNDELNELDCGLELAHDYLKTGGRLVAISFHSLEDRIIKRHINGIDVNDEIGSSLYEKHRSSGVVYEKEEFDVFFDERWTPINKKVFTPTEKEIQLNPRARSAKLRAAIKNKV